MLLAGSADVLPVLHSLTVSGGKKPQKYHLAIPALTDVPLSLCGLVQSQMGSQQREIAGSGWVSLSHTPSRRCLSLVAVGS